MGNVGSVASVAHNYAEKNIKCNKYQEDTPVIFQPMMPPQFSREDMSSSSNEDILQSLGPMCFSLGPKSKDGSLFHSKTVFYRN